MRAADAPGGLSRRRFLAGAGALIVGWGSGGPRLATAGQEAAAPPPADPETVDSWIAVTAAGEHT